MRFPIAFLTACFGFASAKYDAKFEYDETNSVFYNKEDSDIHLNAPV